MTWPRGLGAVVLAVVAVLGLWWVARLSGAMSPGTSQSVVPEVVAPVEVRWSCLVEPPGLAVREQPDGQATVLGWLNAGDAFTAMSRTAEADWLRGEAGGVAGWVTHANVRCAEDLPVWPADVTAPWEPPYPMPTQVVPTTQPPVADGSFIAYRVPAPMVGNQDHAGPLGMNFDVLSPIVVTDLGVFDSDQNGLRTPVRAMVWDRATETVVAELTFRDQDGELVEASRFLPLPEPLHLPAGFQGTMGAEGYSNVERNGNGIGGSVPWTMNDGGGLIRFVGTSLWDWPRFLGQFPTLEDSGPANRYAAGTFRYWPDP